MKKIKKAFLMGLFLLAMGGCSGNSRGEAEEHFKAGRYEEAVQAYSKTLQLDPGNKQALYNRGRAYDELNDYDAAINDLKAAVKIDEKNVRYLLSLGDVYYKQKKYDNALYYYDLAADVERNNPLALFKKAKANHQLGKVEEAMKGYAAALRENEEMGEVYLSRAALKISQNDKKGACEDLRRAESLDAKGAAEALTKYCR